MQVQGLLPARLPRGGAGAVTLLAWTEGGVESTSLVLSLALTCDPQKMWE